MEGLLTQLLGTGQKSEVLIQNPNGPRTDLSQAVNTMKIEEIDDNDEMVDDWTDNSQVFEEFVLKSEGFIL